MFCFIPYRVDVPYDRRPVMNWLLIVFNVVIYMAQTQAGVDYENLIADGWNGSGLIGHMFLHADIFHLAGNMYFLWLFGNAVCAKLGNLLYLPLYLLFGLVSVAFFNIITDGRLVGASGAINGVIGMFLVFYPLNEVDCFCGSGYRGGFLQTITLSSYWLILMWLVFDIFGLFFFAHDNVAYSAHVGGFFAGFALALLLLKKKLIVMEKDERSLVDVIKHRGMSSGYEIPAEYQELYNKRVGIVNRQGAVAPLDNYSEPQPKQQVVNKQSFKEIASQAAFSVKEGNIYFYCDCGYKLKVPVTFSGKKGRCPGCETTMEVPKLKAR